MTNEKKWIIIDDVNGDQFEEVLNQTDRESAIEEAKARYGALTDHDRARRIAYELIFAAVDEDGIPDYDGADEVIDVREIYGKVVNAAGALIDYETAVALMDDELREELHAALAPCSEQEFFNAYEDAHTAKYGDDWELSKANSVY